MAAVRAPRAPSVNSLSPAMAAWAAGARPRKIAGEVQQRIRPLHGEAWITARAAASVSSRSSTAPIPARPRLAMKPSSRAAVRPAEVPKKTSSRSMFRSHHSGSPWRSSSSGWSAASSRRAPSVRAKPCRLKLIRMAGGSSASSSGASGRRELCQPVTVVTRSAGRARSSASAASGVRPLRSGHPCSAA